MQDYNSSIRNEYAMKIGDLDIGEPRTTNGKRVFEWTYRAVLPEGKVNYKIDVVYKVDSQTSNPEGMQGAYFEASCDTFPALKIKDKDIQSLIARITAELDDQIFLLHNAPWEDWLEIEVTGSDSEFSKKHEFAAFGMDVKVVVRRLKRGVCPKTGRVVTIARGNHRYVTDFPQPRKFAPVQEAPEVEMDLILDYKSRSEVSYVKDTPENMAALQEMVSRMQLLRQQLANFLGQDGIEESITKIQASNFLLIEDKD